MTVCHLSPVVGQREAKCLPTQTNGKFQRLCGERAGEKGGQSQQLPAQLSELELQTCGKTRGL